MKKTIYDFSEAVEYFDWYSPSELSSMLKEAVLGLARAEFDYAIVQDAQCVALAVCDFLDKIKEKEIGQ